MRRVEWRGRGGSLWACVALGVAVAAGAVVGDAVAASAQTPGVSSPTTTSSPAAPLNPNAQPAPNTGDAFLDGVLSQSNLLGDMGGARSWLAARGITYGINETSEVLGNPTGGIRTGIDYDGLTLASVGLDTDKAFGWAGGTFNASAFSIHGRDLSTDDLDDLQTASGIEAERSVRLWELWYDQATRDGDADIKIGQQSIDQEFMTSTYTSLFINTVMGWPALPSYDLYAGGPAYPLSSLGVRLRASSGPLTGLIGVYDDNPPGGPFDDDDQLRGAERTGTLFNLDTGALIIGELQFAHDLPSTGQNVKPGATAGGLPGILRIGAWFDTGQFPDQRFDPAGVWRAPPGGPRGAPPPPAPPDRAPIAHRAIGDVLSNARQDVLANIRHRTLCNHGMGHASADHHMGVSLDPSAQIDDCANAHQAPGLRHAQIQHRAQ